MQISGDSTQRRDTSLEINKSVYVTRSQQKRCKYFALLPAGGGKRSAAERQKEDRLSAVLFFGGDGEIRTLDTLLGYTRFPIVRARPATRHLHIVARLSSAYAVFCLTAKVIITVFPRKVKRVFRNFSSFCRCTARSNFSSVTPLGVTAVWPESRHKKETLI